MTLAATQDPSPHGTFKFPAFQPDLLPTPEEDHYGLSSSRSGSPNHGHGAQGNGNATPSDRWQPRKEARFGQSNGSTYGSTTKHGHGRQKSLTEAIRTIRTRKGSVSQNAHELADALKAPLSPKLIVGLCMSMGDLEASNNSRLSVVYGT